MKGSVREVELGTHPYQKGSIDTQSGVERSSQASLLRSPSGWYVGSILRGRRGVRAR